MVRVKCILKRVDWLFISLLFYPIFHRIIFELSSDITKHNEAVLAIIQSKKQYPPNFLYYLIVGKIASFFSPSIYTIKLVSTFILSLAVGYKYKAVAAFFSIKYMHSISIFLLTISSLFIISIPDFYIYKTLGLMYLGRINATVWHNSTTILLFPFTIFLFHKFITLLEENDSFSKKDIFCLFLLIIVNIVIKPSFFIVFAPISIVFLFYKFGNSSSFWIHSSPIILGGLLLLFQTKLIYELQIGSFQNDINIIAIGNPFTFWKHYIPLWYVPISLVISLILPILYFIFYPKDIRIPSLLFPVLLMILSIMISAFIVEKGSRLYHGNFQWQNIICSYLLIISILKHVILKINVSWNMKNITLLSIYFLHVLSGFYYLGRYLMHNNYM